MLKSYCKSFIILAGFVGLFGCSSSTHINLTPEVYLDAPTYNFTSRSPWQVTSEDLRKENNLIEVIRDGKVKQLVKEQVSLRLMVEDKLTQAWQNNKLNINPSADSKINIQLIKSVARVTESSVSYDVSSEMMIQVVVQNQGETFVKMFRSGKQWNAAFTTSVSSVRDQLSAQLTILLAQIINDPQLNQKLQE
jgi:uncharacterized lipoprotein YajG